jgi:hypothetical protein
MIDLDYARAPEVRRTDFSQSPTANLAGGRRCIPHKYSNILAECQEVVTFKSARLQKGSQGRRSEESSSKSKGCNLAHLD